MSEEKEKGKGVLFIAKDKDSFRKFYELVKENIFKPAALALPSKDELKERIQKGLSENATNPVDGADESSEITNESDPNGV